MTDPGNRERGLKAALNNPRVSEQAKERDRKILATEFGTTQFGEHFEEGPAESASAERELSSELSDSYEQIAPARARQTAGLHSASSHPESESSYVKMSSSETIDPPSNKTRSTRRSSTGSSRGDVDGKDAGNVFVPLSPRIIMHFSDMENHSIRGLRSAISNPKVSEDAKEKDRKKLRELGEAVE